MADLSMRDRIAQMLWDAKRAQDPEDFMPTVMTDMGSCLHVADRLIELGVFLPPANATMIQQTTGKFDPSQGSPFGGNLTMSDGRVFSDFGGYTRDVTDEYNAWVSSLPQTTTRAYQWTDE